MNENGTKRREWVKTAAIIFLIILLAWRKKDKENEEYATKR